jgi:hypothetical protein
MRYFETGATRDSSDNKPDYEGFLSPLVIEAYGEYMHSHRMQADGKLRDSDNWQKGMPLTEYMKSLWRHFFDMWKIHRGYPVLDRITQQPVTLKAAACGILFNVSGYLHVFLKENIHSEQARSNVPQEDSLCNRPSTGGFKQQILPYH